MFNKGCGIHTTKVNVNVWKWSETFPSWKCCHLVRVSALQEVWTRKGGREHTGSEIEDDVGVHQSTGLLPYCFLILAPEVKLRDLKLTLTLVVWFPHPLLNIYFFNSTSLQTSTELQILHWQCTFAHESPSVVKNFKLHSSSLPLTYPSSLFRAWRFPLSEIQCGPTAWRLPGARPPAARLAYFYFLRAEERCKARRAMDGMHWKSILQNNLCRHGNMSEEQSKKYKNNKVLKLFNFNKKKTRP